MSTNEAACIDIRRFLQGQSRERYKAFVIHGPPLAGKTRFAQQLADISPSGVYLDLLQYVIRHPNLAPQVDILDVASLQKIVVSYAAETCAKLLLVDELDFLIYTWENELTEFKHMVRSLSVTQTPIIIGFILQTQPALEMWSLPNNTHQNRILQIEEIQAL